MSTIRQSLQNTLLHRHLIGENYVVDCGQSMHTEVDLYATYITVSQQDTRTAQGPAQDTVGMPVLMKRLSQPGMPDSWPLRISKMHE